MKWRRLEHQQMRAQWSTAKTTNNCINKIAKATLTDKKMNMTKGNRSVQERPLQVLPPNRQQRQNRGNFLPHGLNRNARQNLQSMQQAPPQMQPPVLPNQMPFVPRGPTFTPPQQQQHQQYMHRSMQHQMPPQQSRFFPEGPSFPPKQQHQPTMLRNQMQVTTPTNEQTTSSHATPRDASISSEIFQARAKSRSY